MANVTIVTCKMWLTAPKIAQIGNFWYKFPEKEYTPYAIFKIKFGLGRESQIRTCMPNFIVLAQKKWPIQPQKSRKIAIFGINFPLRENLGGPQKKLNIGVQLQTFLYAMTL